MLNFDLLITPPGDGDILIEPPAPLWRARIEHTIRSQSADQCNLQLAGHPVQEIRQQTRDRLFGPHDNRPVIACGHQPEFIHPGVWAKHVVVRHITNRLGACGADLVVDNDMPRSTSLAVPTTGPDGILTRQHLPVLTGTAGAAYEGRPPLRPEDINRLMHGVHDELASNMDSLIGDYCGGMLRAENPHDIVEQHLSGRQRVDSAFAADLPELRVSQAFDGPFVADILLNLDRFAHAYNASLDEYRRDQQVRGPDRPLPDLKSADGRLEAPFWIYQLNQRRRRLSLAPRGDALDAYADDQRVGTLLRSDLHRDSAAALSSLTPWLIRPRALTLTLWARLLVCDLFVHGIGGAKYDRITDGIFQRYYQCPPPSYACVTATLRLPLAHFPVSADDWTAARRRMRDLQFNPHLYLDTAPADLLSEREHLIARHKQLREQRASSIDRHSVFHAIRRINARLQDLDPGLASRLEQQAERIRLQLESNAVTDGRAFFYALQPQSRLDMLAARLREAAHVQ